MHQSDGRKIWVEVTETPIVKDGKTIAVVGSLTDITERKHAEEELRRSEERYRRLYRETPAMLHSIDHDGCLVSVSNHWLEMLGYERSEVLGRRITEFFTEDSRRYAEEVDLPEFFRTGFVKEVPYQLVKKNGEVLDTLLSAIAERDQEGKVIRSLAVIVDVTERKRAQKEIEKVQDQYTDGLITDGERYNKVIDIWAQVTESIADVMLKGLGSEAAEGAKGEKKMVQSF